MNALPATYRPDAGATLLFGLGLGLVLATLSWLGRDADNALVTAGTGVVEVAVTPAPEARTVVSGPLVDLDALRDYAAGEANR